MRKTRVSYFYRSGDKKAVSVSKTITDWLNRNHKNVDVVDEKADFVISLGGDGTILEAARTYQKQNPIIMGLNLGTVGFLASVREEENFFTGLDKLLKGRYKTVKRMMVEAEVIRDGGAVFKTQSLNDVAVQSPLGMVEIEVGIEGYPVQEIRGSGVLVATPTGSTAHNLSAHGPIVMPDIRALVVTELLDHNVPTPSIVVKHEREIHLKIVDFREGGALTLTNTQEKADVILTSDGGSVCTLQKGDMVLVRESKHPVRFAEIEENYFFKSLQEKFGFK